MSHQLPAKTSTHEEDKSQKLKRKYTTLVQTHRKLLDDYNIALDVITKLTNEKAYLKSKLHEILQKAGFEMEDFDGLEELGE